MATRGRKRRQERREKRRENRRLRKEGPDTAFYGGSEEAQQDYQRESRQDVARSEVREAESYRDTLREQRRTRDLESGAENERRGYADAAASSRSAYGSDVDAIGGQANRANYMRSHALSGAQGVRNQAFAQNRLTDTAENALARRTAELAGVPTIGHAVETNIGANNANAQARLAQSMGLANRQARGVAGSLGEGGALAMQQAIASAGANAGDLLAQNNTQQSQLAADMRLEAAIRQNELDVGAADLGLKTRMGAAEQERINQLDVAGANADDILGIGRDNATTALDAALKQADARAILMKQDADMMAAAGDRHTSLLSASNKLALGGQELAQQGLRDARQNNQFIEGTAAGIDQAENLRRYQEAQNKNGFQKFVSTVFDPADFRSSGHKGIV